MKLRGAKRLRESLTVFSVMLLVTAQSTPGHKKPHYVFLLPDGYIGWVQVISQAPNAARSIIEKGNLLVDVDETGVFRTPTFHTMFVGAHDEFFYKRPSPAGGITRVPVPPEYVCVQMSGLDSCYEPSEEKGADGFTVARATVGKDGPSSEGSSWFFFVGPSVLREKYAVRVIFQPSTKKWMDHPENDPIPGRIRNER
jgi:hypothetical protein